MDWLEITAQISQVAGIVSVIFAALSTRANTRISHKQRNIDTFTTYSERHQAATDSFPDNAFYNRLDDSQLPPRSSEPTQAVRRYLLVICDVHYLSYQKYLDDSIWQVWRSDLQHVLSTALQSSASGQILNLSLSTLKPLLTLSNRSKRKRSRLPPAPLLHHKDAGQSVYAMAI